MAGTILAAPDDGSERAIVGIDYDEFKPETFRSVVISIGDETRPYATMAEARAFLDAFDGDVLYSSSFHSFRADGGSVPESRH